MNQDTYTGVWKAITAITNCSKKVLVPLHIFTALRLSIDKKDGHVHLLQRIIKNPHASSKLLYRQFKQVIHQQPYSPLDALCILYRGYPKLSEFLGLSEKNLMVKIQKSSQVVTTIVPQLWTYDKGEQEKHFFQLIRSIEMWLQAFYYL